MFEIIVIVILILLNAFFSLTEAAFIGSRKSLLTAHARKGKTNAAFLLKMLENPEYFLSSIQICITLIGIVSGVFGGLALAGDFSKWLALTGLSPELSYDLSLVIIVAIITYFSIVIGELVPKTIAMNNPEWIALAFTPVIRLVMLLFKPVVNLLSLSTKLILTLLGIRDKVPAGDPVREIVSMIRMASVNKELGKEQEKIILNTINMAKIALRDIMVAVPEIKYLDSSLSISEAFLQVHIHHHTRYPVVENNDLDRIIGYVNFKDIVNVLKINPARANLLGICRPVIKFNQNEKIVDVLRAMIKNSQHISVATKKKNQTAGLVTLEDIIECLVGDIFDEYDVIPDYFYKISENHYVIGGGIKMKKLEEKLGVKYGEHEKTLSDWLLARAEQNMAVGSRHNAGPCSFIIRRLKSRQIYEVLLEMK